MASIHDMSAASSDSEDDVDYVPSKGAESDLSEDELSGSDIEEFPKPKKVKLDDNCVKGKLPTAVEEKKNVDEIWKSFLNSVDSVPRKEAEKEVPGASSTENAQLNTPHTLQITIEGSPSVNIESGDILSKSENPPDKCNKSAIPESPKPEIVKKIEANTVKEPQSKLVVPLPAKSNGLSSILGAIANSKNKKMTVLEKSLNDWKTFKKEKGIEKDLEIYNKGRQGFLERQRFLERSDLRSYETEKNLRLGRKKQ